MTKLVLACIVLAVACKKPDDCHRVANALARVAANAPLPPGKSVDDMKDIVIGECKKDPEGMKKDKDMQCILAATSEAAEDACLKKGFEDYGKKSRATGAELELNRIAKNAKMAYIESSAFPIGTAKALPAIPDPTFKGCCGGKSNGNEVDNKCPVTTEWASDPVWKALDFSIDEPSNYRYSYQGSDGKSFTATAVGDLDCDNEEATYTLTGKIDASGNPVTAVVKPPANTY